MEATFNCEIKGDLEYWPINPLAREHELLDFASDAHQHQLVLRRLRARVRAGVTAGVITHTACPSLALINLP